MPGSVARQRSSSLARRLGRYQETLRSRGLGNWLVVLVLLVGGTFLGLYLENDDSSLRARYSIYQFLQHLMPAKPHAKRTVLVLIGDDEYWGDLGGRSPVRRDYLARLLLALRAAEPSLVALDFRPTPAGVKMQESQQQRAEDAKLFGAVDEVAAGGCPIVLPALLVEGEGRGAAYSLAPSIFPRHAPAGNVSVGHIMRLGDIRQIPVGLRLNHGERQDSFAEAIARQVDPESLSGLDDDDYSLPFATFIPGAMIPQLSARTVLKLSPSALRPAVRSKIVIVSGSWSRNGYGQGDPVDVYDSPVGPVSGAVIQANYVEAILDSRAIRPLNRPLAVTLELFLSAVIALLFALTQGSWGKFSVVVGVCTFTFLTGYILLQNLGRYFDFYLPMVLLAGHAAVERIREWRSDALELHRKEAAG